MTRLVVVDDAPFIREIVRQVVEGAGISLVGEATDGQEAVELVLRLKPDVVLMDIIMPRKSGIEATKEIIATLPETKIIAFSTADQAVMVLRALEAGCCSFLEKPFAGEDLVKVITSAMAK